MNAMTASRTMTAQEAAELIHHGDVIGASGFTPSGYPKVIPVALAERAAKAHEEGRPFQVSLYTGASTGDELDGVLARAKALSRRLPYQSNPDVRAGINAGEIEFTDMHLSHVGQMVRWGFLPTPTVALVEAVEVTADGRIYLSASGGASASYLQTADRILIELNSFYGPSLKGYHDVYIPEDMPHRMTIPLLHSGDRIGTDYVQVDPARILGVVETCLPDRSGGFKEPDQDSKTIASHILEFLKREKKLGRLHGDQPYQSGVGNVANAVLGSMATDPSQPPVSIYTEVMQDSVIQLLQNDKLVVASGAAMTLSPACQALFKANMDAWRDKFIIRQMEISNSPGIARRLGIIAMNTALELDIFGNVNSTHVMGTRMMNGIGGSGDFTRNAFLPIFMTPSTAKGGAISSIVPMVSHVDHTEHDTMVFVTEQGLADVRGMGPERRAREIIARCAHPDYRPMLLDYLEEGLRNGSRHTPVTLKRAFEFHDRFLATGSMKA
jgi:acetyl-CoA hydrolase/succinyl-CoA:acetate CoA-transferase